MKIAFYAPMKSPTAAKPSGDRTIGRLLMAALTHAGFDVRLASELRTWSSVADSSRLDVFRAQAARETDNLVTTWARDDSVWAPDIWLTYHAYYKAPDLLGPLVSAKLRLPYVIVEASYARRRTIGEWADWLAAAREGITAANAIFNLTARDREGLSEICNVERLHDLSPFLDLDAYGFNRAKLANNANGAAATTRLITVAMMRPGAKLSSYELLAAALGTLLHRDWQLDIIGDGEARAAVEKAFAALPANRVRFLGQLDAPATQRALGAGDVFVWPGIDEAFGMVYLEAQAASLPVAALRTAGVPEVVRHGETGYLASGATPEALAACIERLIDHPAERRRLGAVAREIIERHHSLPSASARLDRVLSSLVRSQ